MDDGTGDALAFGDNHSSSGRVFRPGKAWYFEVIKPFLDLLRRRVGEEEAYLAVDSLFLHQSPLNR
jgi:hypothetical protein